MKDNFVMDIDMARARFTFRMVSFRKPSYHLPITLGDIYEGSWNRDHKHGRGIYRFDNSQVRGDMYDGEVLFFRSCDFLNLVVGHGQQTWLWKICVE